MGAAGRLTNSSGGSLLPVVDCLFCLTARTLARALDATRVRCAPGSSGRIRSRIGPLQAAGGASLAAPRAGCGGGIAGRSRGSLLRLRAAEYQSILDAGFRGKRNGLP